MTEQVDGVSPRVLDPVERSFEVLMGLIMVLSFAASIGAATAGREEIRTMLFGGIGASKGSGRRA